MEQARQFPARNASPRIVPLTEPGKGLKPTRTSQGAGFSKLIFKVSGGAEFVDPAQVIVLGADSNYTRVMMRAGRTILLSRTLKDCSRVFPATFLRVHQSWLVNPACIRWYDRKNATLHLENETTVPVSRSGKAVVEQLIDRYAR